MDLVYYDRFSNLKTQSRVLMEMTATLKVLGGGASWKGFLMVGIGWRVLEEDGVEVWRRRVGFWGRKGGHRPSFPTDSI